MGPRGLIAISLLAAMSAGITLFALGHITTVAWALTLTLLGLFWILLPVLFLAAIAWDHFRSLKSRRNAHHSSDGQTAPAPR